LPKSIATVGAIVGLLGNYGNWDIKCSHYGNASFATVTGFALASLNSSGHKFVCGAG